MGVRHQPDDTADGRSPHFWRFALQVRLCQFQGLGAGVVGQFRVQPYPTLGRQVRTSQLLIQHPRGAGLAIACLFQGFAVTALDSLGNLRRRTALPYRDKTDRQHNGKTEEQVAARRGHAGNP